ncbi:hypothetical protein PLICRDRAFT_30838 [Plicaturopsis crispa FD-325 SS-3]|nr:hypothetical protein PLICRDRAFT_30838 [Plicaturopsis crispa FD-325 SS-3]
MEPGLMRDSLQRQQDQLRRRREGTQGQVQPHPPTHPQRTPPPMVFDNEPPTADVLSGQYLELPPRPRQINRSAAPGRDIGSSGRIWGLDVNGWPVDIHNHLVQWWKDGQRVMRPQTMPLIEVNGLEPSSDYRFGHLSGLDRSGWPIDDNGVRFPAYAEELHDVYDDSGMDDDLEVEEEKKRREKKRAARAYRKEALRRAEEQGPVSIDAEFPPLGQPGRPFTPLPAKSLAPPKGKKALRNEALGLPPPLGFRPLKGRADPSTTNEVDELFQRAEGNSNRGRAFTQRARTWVSRLQARAAHEKANNRLSTLTAVEKYALKTWRRPAWLVEEEQGNAPTKTSKAPASKPPAPSKPAAGPSQPTLADPPQAWINWVSQLGRTIRGVPRAPNGRWPMRNLRGMRNLNGLLNHDMCEFNVNLIGLNAWTAHYAQLIQELGLQINLNRTYVRYRGEYDGGFPPMAMAHRAARWLADRGVTLAEAGDNHAFAFAWINTIQDENLQGLVQAIRQGVAMSPPPPPLYSDDVEWRLNATTQRWEPVSPQQPPSILSVATSSHGLAHQGGLSAQMPPLAPVVPGVYGTPATLVSSDTHGTGPGAPHSLGVTIVPHEFVRVPIAATNVAASNPSTMAAQPDVDMHGDSHPQIPPPIHRPPSKQTEPDPPTGESKDHSNERQYSLLSLAIAEELQMPKILPIAEETI